MMGGDNLVACISSQSARRHAGHRLFAVVMLIMFFLGFILDNVSRSSLS